MRKVHTAESTIEIAHLRNVLESDGIACFVRNDRLGGVVGEIPFLECWPELWVVESGHALQARGLIEQALRPRPSATLGLPRLRRAHRRAVCRVLALRRPCGAGGEPDRVTTITIDRRFNGPPDSGNGGYVCGAFAVATGSDLRVRLVAPPPLEAPLDVAQDDATVDAGSQQATLRTGTPRDCSSTCRRRPRYVQAVWASQHYAGFRDHFFPDCFVCGPHRRRGDGLRIFPGQLDTGLVAAPWLPADSLDGGDGKVAANSTGRRSTARDISRSPPGGA